MGHLSIRDLQKISGKAISDLPGATAIKSGNRTIGMLIPYKRANLERLEAALARANELAKGRNPREDDEALRAFGDVDPMNYTVDVVRKIQAGEL